MKRLFLIATAMFLLSLTACIEENLPSAPPLTPPPPNHGTLPDEPSIEPSTEPPAEPPILWLRHDEYTLEEARSDPDFGPFILRVIPNEFQFRIAFRFIASDDWPMDAYSPRGRNGLFLAWDKYAGMDSSSIALNISEPTQRDFVRIVSPDDTKTWDLAYFGENHPILVSEQMRSPVFFAEDLTPEIVAMRVGVEDHNMDFGLLFDDILVQIRGWGVSPEQIWAILDDLIIP